MNSLKIVNIDHIAPLPGPYSSPGDTITLSFFDTFLIAIPPSRMLFLYPDISNPNISTLKSSLSKTLLNFHSLTGKITYDPSTSDVIIDCRREINEGVKFIEAEYENLSIAKLAKDEIHNVDAFENLVPVIDIDVLHAPAMAVQLTKFVSGGVAMGMAFHHMVVDGIGGWEFISTWSKCCRGNAVDVGNGARLIVDRALVNNYRSGSEVVARSFVKRIKPNFPNATCTSAQPKPQAIRRTLHISTTAIEKIKEYIMNNATTSNSLTMPPSKFAILTSIVWICFAKAKAISSDGNSTIFIPLDARSILDPPLPETYTGNCLKPLYATIKWSKLQSKDGLVEACMEIIRTINEGKNVEPLNGYEEWTKPKAMINVLPSMKLYVSSSLRFRAYDFSDFGWGKPERVEIISVNSDGSVAYSHGKEDGQVQVLVVLSPLYMDRFVQEFVKFSSVGKSSSLVLSRI